MVQGFMSKKQFRHKSVDYVLILHESHAEGSKCGQQLGPFHVHPCDSRAHVVHYAKMKYGEDLSGKKAAC